MGGLLVGLGDTLTWIQCCCGYWLVMGNSMTWNQWYCCYCLSCNGLLYNVTYTECYVVTLLYLLALQMLLSYLLELQMIVIFAGFANVVALNCWYCNWLFNIGLLCCGAPPSCPPKREGKH